MTKTVSNSFYIFTFSFLKMFPFPFAAALLLMLLRGGAAKSEKIVFLPLGQQ